jgi:hypothetical protein
MESKTKGERKMKTYIVGIGGSPTDTWDEYDDRDDAINAAIDMALDMAVEKGLTPESVDIDTWETDDESGTIGGACPEGDTGGYWPVVKVKP